MSIPDRIWINEKWEAYLRPTFEGDTSGYIRADLAAVQPAQVRIKPLVWEEPCYTNNWIHVARSVLGDYYISIDGGRHSAWLEANVKPYENKIGDDVGSAIEAMMLAETDYQARMQPLITPQPDPRDEVIAKLVGALSMAQLWLAYAGASDMQGINAALAAAKTLTKETKE